MFPTLPRRSGFHRRRGRLTETIEWLIGVFASRSPGDHDDLLLIDSTPVECARSREKVKRGGSSCLADALSRHSAPSHPLASACPRTPHSDA